MSGDPPVIRRYHRPLRRALFVSTSITVVLAAAAIGFSTSWKRTRTARLHEGSQLIQTARGWIEYATLGEGPVVLISHGSPGGYDQGLLVAKLLGGQVRFISVSRPGYLRTPLDVGKTYEEQADAFAALLDALHIQHSAIIGVSSGGPAALQFALRYPERCWGLVLISAVVQRPQTTPPPINSWLGRIATSDLSMWLLDNTITYSPGLLLLLIMPNEAQRARLLDDRENRDLFVEFTRTAYPFGLRSAGTSNDIEQHYDIPLYPLDRVRAPTLAVYGTADLQVPFTAAEHAANTIPSVELIPIEGGDHASLITHKEVIAPRVSAFLIDHAPK